MVVVVVEGGVVVVVVEGGVAWMFESTSVLSVSTSVDPPTAMQLEPCKHETPRKT